MLTGYLRLVDSKGWKLINAVEGFNIYANEAASAGDQTREVKKGVSNLITNVETLAAWTQSMTSVIVVSMFVASLFFIVNDFCDELNFNNGTDLVENYRVQRRWAISLKICSSVYIFIAMTLAIKNQYDNSRVLSSRLSENRNLISVGLDFYDTNTQYKMKTSIPIS